MAHQDLSPLNVVARAPFHLYYDGPAERVSATNKVGNFDILPGHADFFSILNPGTITIETKTDMITFTISNGILAVRNEKVMLFVNI